MPFIGMSHGSGVADGDVAKLLPLWQHASAFWHHAVWILIVMSHNAWMGYEYSLPNLNRMKGMCDNYVYLRIKKHNDLNFVRYLMWILSGILKILYPPHNKVVGGILVSLHLSVRPSFRPASHVGSVAPTVLVGSISYSCILSRHFRRCVTYKSSSKISKFVFLAIFLTFVTLIVSCFDLGSHFKQILNLN